MENTSRRSFIKGSVAALSPSHPVLSHPLPSLQQPKTWDETVDGDRDRFRFCTDWLPLSRLRKPGPTLSF